MSEAAPVTVDLRIPGQWAHPQELVRRLPAGHRLTEAGLVLPDETVIQFGAAAPDDQFAGIFRSSCRKPPGMDELASVNTYKVMVFLSGPGGSLDAARTMMRAGAAIIRAGGAGVFIDNSTLAHGGRDWLNMTDDGSSDAVSFAFVSIVRGKSEVFTMGMHVLGLRDLVMSCADVDDEGGGIIDMIRYMARNEKPVEDGHLIVDLDGPRFKAMVQPGDETLKNTVLHNPFGRLKLMSLKDIAETN